MKYIFFLLFLFCCFQTKAQILKDCSSCSTQIIKTEQIKDLSIDEIRYLTNDLFARKGYRFTNSNIDLYYSEKNWYKPIDDNNKIVYNDTEKKNIKQFQDKTAELNADREALIKELKNFKLSFLQADEKILKSKYGYDLGIDPKNTYLNDSGEEHRKYFKEVLNKLNIDDINWIKEIGFYKVTVDNLNSTIGYEVRIEHENIYFKYDFDTGSEEIKESLYPTEYFIEFTYFWKFEWKNNKLKFIDLIVAG